MWTALTPFSLGTWDSSQAFSIHLSKCSEVVPNLISKMSAVFSSAYDNKDVKFISTRHAVGLYWVPGHAGVQGKETAEELARDGSTLEFDGPQPALGDSRQDIQRRIRCWLVKQHWVWWRGIGDTQRQAQELISGPCLGAKARFVSFNRTQSRAGLLTGRNTLRRHLHLIGLSDSPLCRRCGEEEETSAHILCEFEALASLRHVYLCSFVLEPEDIKSINLGGI